MFAHFLFLRHQKTIKKQTDTMEPKDWTSSLERKLLVKKMQVINDLPAFKKDAANEGAGYKYVSLDTLLSELKKYMQTHDLAMEFLYDGERTQMSVKLALWLVLRDMETGYSEKRLFEFPVTTGQTDPIKIWKSTWTYARRAALEITFNMTSDEDPDSMADTRQGQARTQPALPLPANAQPQGAAAPREKTFEWQGNLQNESDFERLKVDELTDKNKMAGARFVMRAVKALYNRYSEMPDWAKKKAAFIMDMVKKEGWTEPDKFTEGSSERKCQTEICSVISTFDWKN